jgi:hypothetical protein
LWLLEVLLGCTIETCAVVLQEALANRPDLAQAAAHVQADEIAAKVAEARAELSIPFFNILESQTAKGHVFT